jgi:hypothetical protein
MYLNRKIRSDVMLASTANLRANIALRNWTRAVAQFRLPVLLNYFLQLLNFFEEIHT